jgi:CHAD domain-containing protein
MDTRIETEAKYTISDKETFTQLSRLKRFKRFSRRSQAEQRLHDRYLDTDDHRFYNRQYFVRLRQKVGQEDAEAPMLLTIKHLGGSVAGAIRQRDEYEARVPGIDIMEWPEGGARRLGEEIAGGKPLRHLVNVDQLRHVYHIYDGARPVGEMSLDEISIETGHGPVEAYELEIELLPDGTLSDLQGICAYLEAKYNLKPQPLSKFERALQLGANGNGDTSPGADNVQAIAEPAAQGLPSGSSPQPPAPDIPETKKKYPVVEPADSIAEASRKMLSRYADSMLANEEGTIAGEDLEALHDMRVATRRIRAVLRLLGPYMDGKSTDKLSLGVRAITRALGGVRDLDVLMDHARSFQSSLPEEERTDLDGLIGMWEKERKGLRKRLVRVLNSNDYLRFKRRMARFLEADSDGSAETDPMQPHQVRHVAGSAIWARYEEVRAAETVMDAPTIEQLHALRIHGKYLRYTLESFRGALPSETDDLIKDVVAMQDHLGAMHDADVASILIHDYIAGHYHKRKGNKESAVPAGLAAYLDERETAVRRLVDTFGPLWSRISSPKWRSRLANLVAAL